MTKATMIRRVARDGGYGQANGWIQREVKNRYGVRVGANQVIETLGAQRERLRNRADFPRLLSQAERLLHQTGGKVQAYRLLSLADQQTLE